MEICRLYLESEYGSDMASFLSSPFYYKQVEYTDKKGKKKTKIDSSAAPVLYAKLIYSEKSKKILSLFKTKGNKDLNPFKYIDQYCNVKMALIIEGIYISKTVVSLQIQVHECYVKQLKPRESLLTIDEESEVEQSEIKRIMKVILRKMILLKGLSNIGFIFNTIFVLKINQNLETQP